MLVLVEIIFVVLVNSEMLKCHKCNKVGHMQKVVYSSTAVVQ